MENYELRNIKADVEDKIKALLEEFQQKTGAFVLRVDIEIERRRPSDEYPEPSNSIETVSISIEV